jgi:hypothetical protein
MASSSSRSGSSETTRVEAGVALVAIGAALLFLSLFLHWYQPGRSAWTVFEVWDLVLAALSVVALVAVAGRLRLARPRPDSWVVVPSVTAFVIVVAALVNHPPAAIGANPMIGIWLALFAAVLMLAGVALSVANVSVAINIHGGADANPVAGPAATSPETERGTRRRHLRRSAPVAAVPPDDGPERSAPSTSDAPTEATRVLDDDPASPNDPPAGAP